MDKPTTVCKNRATMIDNILILLHHFPIIFIIQTGKNQSKYQTLVYNKSDFNEANKAAFKKQLSLLHWRHVSAQKDVNKMHETFRSTFLEIYETNFPYKQATVKPKDEKNPWMSEALKK